MVQVAASSVPVQPEGQIQGRRCVVWEVNPHCLHHYVPRWRLHHHPRQRLLRLHPPPRCFQLHCRNLPSQRRCLLADYRVLPSRWMS